MGTIDGSDLNIPQRSKSPCSAEKLPHSEESHCPTSLMNKKHVNDYSRSQHPGSRKKPVEDSSSNELVETFRIGGTNYRDKGQ